MDFVVSIRVRHMGSISTIVATQCQCCKTFLGIYGNQPLVTRVHDEKQVCKCQNKISGRPGQNV